MDYKEKFIEIFKDVMEVEEFSENYTLQNLNQWDSLRTVELIIEIENEFDFKLQRNDMVEMTSIKSIYKILAKYINYNE